MIKPPLFTFCSLLGILAIDPVMAGQIPSASVPHSVQGIAEREISRRNDQIARAQQAIAEGDKVMRVKDYEVAVQQYKSAVDVLTESPVTHNLRAAAMERFCNASVRLAEQRIAEGRYADAEAAAKAVLADDYNPRCKAALALLARLEEPGYYNKTITPKFHANVEQVKAWFVEAQGFYDTGRYEMAMKRYDQILGIDPTNEAAREGQIRVNLARSQYAEKAYEEARSRQLWKVTDSWQSPVRKYGAARTGTVMSGPLNAGSTAAIQNKLNNIIIPKVELKDATVREAIDFLKKKSAELDVREPDPSRKGVNIVLQLETPGGGSIAPAPADPAAAPAIPGLDPGAAATAGGAAPAAGVNPADARITLSLSNMPLAEVLRYITTLAGLKVKIDQYAVAIVPITVVTDQLITKEYKVPPGAFQNAVANGGGAAAAAPSARGSGNSSMITGAIGPRVLAKDYFAGQGVQFPPGAAANFIPSSSRLIVKNTQDNIDLIDVIVEALNNQVPMQVDIEAKFVEITQKNLKELSFDWTLGQFNIPGSKRIFGGGGNTVGDDGTYPFVDPNGNVVGGQSLTSSNRTGTGISSAISSNAIDSLLYPAATNSAITPGVLSMAGVFTDPQFQVVMRALNQKKGIDLLSSPRVTTKSGQRATIEIVREFKYPTEYNPPQVPSSSGSGGGGVIAVTPTTPSSFEVRNTGVSLEVEPVVGSDGSTIDLNLVPQVTEFEGFINYGSPIYSSDGGFLTANIINQPIFSTRKVQTSVSVWDGQTVMLGGLMREDVQKVEDKVPFLGDIPYVGRLFRSSVDQHQKRNLVIFVTAKLINPAGDPINAVEDDKDEVTESVGPVPATLGAPEAESLLPTK